MSDNASDRGKEKGNGTDGDEYIIDETVTLDDEPFAFWDLDIDPEEQETHVIRAIGRTDGTRVKAHILPKEELEYFKNDENVWTEYSSNKTLKLSDSVTISNEDEDPFYHDGDYVLCVETRGGPDTTKFSIKFRRA